MSVAGDILKMIEENSGGAVDLSIYQPKTMTSSVTIGGATETTVEGSIDEVASVIPSIAATSNKLSTALDTAKEDITATANSSDIALTDSADARVNGLKIYGRTEDGTSVGENGLTVTEHGKNILQFDDNLQTVEKNGITFEPRTDGGIYVHGTASSNASYVFCDDRSSHNVAGLRNFDGCYLNVNGVPANMREKIAVQLALKVDPWTLITQSNSPDGVKITYTNENRNTAKSIYILIRNGGTVDCIIYPMIYRSGGTTTFEPFKTNTLSITTGLPLRRKMFSVDLGSLDWTYQTGLKSYPNGYSYSKFVSTTLIDGLFDPTRSPTENIRPDIETWFDNYREDFCSCDSRYTASRAAGGFEPISDKTFIVNPQGKIYIIDNDYTDPADFKAAVTGITLTYPSYCDEIDLADGVVITRIDSNGDVLAEPVTTPLTAAEKAAFDAFRTFEGSTNITATDDPFMSFIYVKNTENGKAVANVDDRIGVTYSTSEVNTGDKWIDGKPIYRRTVHFSGWNGNDRIDPTVDIEVSSWDIDSFFVDYAHSNIQVQSVDKYQGSILNYSSYSTDVIYIDNANDKYIMLRQSGLTGKTLISAHYTILYTKTTDSGGA